MNAFRAVLFVVIAALVSSACRNDYALKTYSLSRSDFSFHVGDYWEYKMSYGDTVRLTVGRVFEGVPGTTQIRLVEIGSRRIFTRDTIGTYTLSDTSFTFACRNGITEDYIVNHVIQSPFTGGLGWKNNRPILFGKDSMFFQGVSTDTINGVEYKEVYTFHQPPLANAIPAERVESELKYVKGIGIVYQRNLNRFEHIDQRMVLLGFHRK